MEEHRSVEEPDDSAAAGPPAAPPPTTGHAEIDRALADLDLGEDVHQHHDAFAAAVEAVQRALNPASQGPRPQP